MTTPLLLARVRRTWAPVNPGADPRLWPWFLCAMLYAAGCAFLALRQAFASEYMLADDVREHVFWMFRYVDPALFPRDPIADYFQSLAPSGFAALYRFLTQLGIDPLLASKVIPSGLSFISVGYFFGLAWRFFRSPAAATLTAILFAQCLWLNSDLSSATPRAFFYPLFAAFLYYHVRGSIIGVLVAIALEAAFFPPAALLSLGVLGWSCLRWENGPRLVSAPRVYLVAAAGFGLTLLCLWPYLRSVGVFGPLVTFAEAKSMPEFGPEGRVPVFLPTWWGYWVGGNAGIHNLPTRPPWFLLPLLWPLLRRRPARFPFLKTLPGGARLVPQIIGASLLLFASAHVLLFRLYLPNRYTQATMRVLLTLLAGGVIIALLDAAILRWSRAPNDHRSFRGPIILSGVALVLILLLAYPLLIPAFPTNSYVRGNAPGLYRFFASQPATIRIASVSDEADNLPTFSRRSIIIGAECAVPFHPAYYLPLRERGLQIARAQYSDDPALVEQCVRDQQIDFWLLERKAFTPKYHRKSRLLRHLRLVAPQEELGRAQGKTPLLKTPPPGSIVYQDARYIVVDARRLFTAK
ncbi:MAG: hypothetical protein M3429_04705 [Verrucomicrobiota bacterium]|nr:hypothetical protein [Verrucomicrobiota bacterium]